MRNADSFERAVTAFERDVSANNSTEPTEDELFGKIVALKLKKIQDCDQKEDLKIEILHSLNGLQREQGRRRENNRVTDED